LKLNLKNDDFARIIACKEQKNNSESFIDQVLFDTRLIYTQDNMAFFAFDHGKSNGLDFVEDAYQKGVRHLVVHKIPLSIQNDAYYYVVENVLQSLHLLALYHRKQFKGNVIGITGTHGKTTFKEWAYNVLNPSFKVYRGPKSYNSQIGVAISILNANLDAHIWLIEAAISEKNEMDILQKMILPNLGVFTHFGKGFSANFENEKAYFSEIMKLFTSVEKCFIPKETIFEEEKKENWIFPSSSTVSSIETLKFKEKSSKNTLALLFSLCKFFSLSDEQILDEMEKLNHLAQRLETFEGIFNSTIINDSYSLDEEAFMEAISYQKQLTQHHKRVLILSKTESFLKLEKIAKNEGVDTIIEAEKFDISSAEKILNNAVVLIKGNGARNTSELSQLLQLKKHKTLLTIHLSEIRHNISQLTKNFPKTVKILAMVKAAGYGAGAEQLSLYLQRIGVDYLGVAYADEGVELRKAGVKLPILVMNAEEEAFSDIIHWNLEPAIYCFDQLDYFITTCIKHKKFNHPIQLKLETGMHRLGIESHELDKILNLINAQPEVFVSGVYSHLADSDNHSNRAYTENQIEKFDALCKLINEKISNPFLKHILNSEGVANFPNACYDMIRLGIGMYGLVSDQKIQESLKPVVSWSSSVSQVKEILKGESIGYGASFVALENMKIAVIPVGYADGYKRLLGNGVGKVFIQNVACSTVGKVCMDMIMVDVSNLNIIRGEKVEIIGENQTIDQFAKLNETIAYEILTSISKRVHRVYLEM
jgi:Alr-MurF fusion protein